jgi:hypothetical protein
MDGMKGGKGEGEVAEMYKAVERMVPRIEEQVLSYEKWFQTHGREDSDKKQTQKITAFLTWQLEQDRFRMSVQPAIRTMLIYGFCAIKTWWETRYERRIKRSHRRVMEAGKSKIKTSLKETEQVVFNGPRQRLVDPFDFVIDMDATDVPNSKFIGDVTKMTFDQIAALGREGVFQNWEGLADASMLERHDYNAWYKEERDRGMHEITHGRQQVRGGPKEFYIAEIWGLFDLYDEGFTRECVVTVANFTVPIRIQENPFDDKHRPYACARANRDAFDFFSIAPLDNAIRPQLEMNQHRDLALKSHKLALSPFLFVADTDDLPDNLWEIEPGAILPVANPGAISEVSLKSTMGEMQYSDQILSMDIEEVSGGTRVLGGVDNSNTATESTNKLSESSRRLRAYIQSYTMGLNDMLTQWHALNTQYVTNAMEFRVLGKGAKGLNAYEEIDPEILQTEVDFTFTALGSLHSGDLRATQLMQYLNLMAPMMQQHPGAFDQLRMARLLWDDMVGAIDGSEVIHIPTPVNELLSQDEETIMLLQGQEVEVDDQDDHEEHLEALLPVMDNIHAYDASVRALLARHYEQHVSKLNQKRSAARRQQQEQQQNQQMPFAQPQQPLDPNRGTTGNQRMQNGAVQPGDGSMFGQPGSTPGETPGMAGMGQMAAMDRQPGMFQDQNTNGAQR